MQALWLEASSTTTLFSIFLTNSISNNLIGKYDELDKVPGKSLLARECPIGARKTIRAVLITIQYDGR